MEREFHAPSRSICPLSVRSLPPHLVTLDAATPLTVPRLQSLTPAAQMQVTIPGYGAALLRLCQYGAQLDSGRRGERCDVSIRVPWLLARSCRCSARRIGPPTPAFLTLTNPRLVANSLEGVQVYFDGVPAPLLYASAGQVNVVVPYSVAGKSTTQVQLEYLGVLSNPVTLQVAATAPGIFSITGSRAKARARF